MTLVPGSQHWIMIAAGSTPFASAFCGLTDTNDAYCMGSNSSGQLGDGTTTDHATMLPVIGGLKFTKIVGAEFTMCGLTASGAVYCWGDGTGGQLGVAPGVTVTAPTLLPGGLQFATLSGSSDGVCGTTVDGSIYCWGTRNNSALGNGELDDRRIGVPMSGATRFLLYEPGSAALRAGLRAKQP